VDLQQQVLRLFVAGVEQQLLVPLQAAGQLPLPAAAAAAAAASLDSSQAGESAQQQEVRICGDNVCAQVLAGYVVGATTHSEPSVQSRVSTHAAATTTSSSSSSSSSLSSGLRGSSNEAAAANEAAVQQWFTAALGIPCRLVRQMHSSRTVKQQQQQQQQARAVSFALANGHSPEPRRQQTLGFANESQYLLINQASVDYVGGKLSRTSTAAAAAAAGEQTEHVKQQVLAGSSTAAAVDAVRFRPNLVVAGFEPWAEDAWSSVVFTPAELPAPASVNPSPQAATTTQGSSFNQQHQHQVVRAGVGLQVVGPCGRCDMVSIDQSTGQRSGSQLLSLLARERRVGGKLQFGVLLANGGEVQVQAQTAPLAGAQWLHVGDVVKAVEGGKH
jgi:uncharacterized protein YcbX